MKTGVFWDSTGTGRGGFSGRFDGGSCVSGVVGFFGGEALAVAVGLAVGVASPVELGDGGGGGSRTGLERGQLPQINQTANVATNMSTMELTGQDGLGAWGEGLTPFVSSTLWPPREIGLGDVAGAKLSGGGA